MDTCQIAERMLGEIYPVSEQNMSRKWLCMLHMSRMKRKFMKSIKHEQSKRKHTTTMQMYSAKKTVIRNMTHQMPSGKYNTKNRRKCKSSWC